MKLTISKIDQILFSGDALSVTVPASGGEMTILAHHMPLITTLKSGTIKLVQDDKDDLHFPVESGFLKIGKTETVILL
jgi:F-type H+-transporting ATPase subunit epsilon